MGRTPGLDEDDELSEYEVCIGSFCFLQPQRAYVPPPFYRRFPGWNYRWKVGAKLAAGRGFQLKIQRALTIPSFFGLGDDARWQWQGIPLSLLLGIKVKPFVWKNCGCSSQVCSCLLPYIHLRSLTPILGKLALQPMLELFPNPTLIMRREFSMGQSNFMLRANIEVRNSFKCLNHGRKWLITLDWHPTDTALVQSKPANGALAVQYSQVFSIPQDCKLEASAVTEFSSARLNSRFEGNRPMQMKICSVKVSEAFGIRAARDTPLPTSSYLKASKDVGRQDTITVVPGHWIDPGSEQGAPGERDFNLEVANIVERQLNANGWKVLRPDRDAPYLSWEEYLNWVSKQTRKGIPVLEIHGQGSTADYRGFVLGVIGDIEAPLSKELAGDFGIFKMDWRELGVSRRGGVIVESFNADEVLQMAPWHRIWAVKHIANRIVGCIESASLKNRAARGMFVDFESEDDPIKLCGIS